MKNFLFIALATFSFFLIGCSTSPDECDEITWYEDFNQNGFGNPEVSIVSCEQPEGYVDNAEDMNDDCVDVPYLQPYWALCSSANICEMDEYPIIVMLDDEVVIMDTSFTFQWTNSTTGVQTALNSNQWTMIDKNDTIILDVEFPDGCQYSISFTDDCQ